MLFPKRVVLSCGASLLVLGLAAPTAAFADATPIEDSSTGTAAVSEASTPAPDASPAPTSEPVVAPAVQESKPVVVEETPAPASEPAPQAEAAPVAAKAEAKDETPAPTPESAAEAAPVATKVSAPAPMIVAAIDTVRPVVTLQPAPSIFNSNNVDLVITATDNEELVKIVGNIRNSSNAIVLPAQTSASGTSGTLTIDLANLTDGTYNLRYNALDASGNVASTKSFDFTIDNTAPDVTVKSDTVFSNNRTSVISFKLYDAGKIVRSVLNGKGKPYSPNPWSDLNGVKPGTFGAVEGLNTLVVYDAADNSTTMTFILDTTGPALSIKNTSLGDGVMYLRELDLKAFDAANVAAFIRPDGSLKPVTPNPWSDMNDVVAPDGLTVVGAIDDLGNRSSLSYISDNTLPIITTPAAGQVVGGVHTWDISQVEANPDKTYVEIQQMVNSKWKKLAGQWVYNTNDLSTTFDTTGLDDSLQTQIKISTWDKAGNKSGAAFGVVIDNTAPVVNWQLQPDAVYGIDSSFHVRPISPEAGLTKSVYIDAVAPENLVRTLTSDHKNFDTKSAQNQALWDSLSDGSHTFIAVFTDAVGNQTVLPSASFVIDRTAPVVTDEGQEWQEKDGGRTSITLTFSEEVSGLPQGWYGSGTTWTKAFYNVKPATVDFVDAAGNPGSYEVTPIGAPAGVDPEPEIGEPSTVEAPETQAGPSASAASAAGIDASSLAFTSAPAPSDRGWLAALGALVVGLTLTLWSNFSKLAGFIRRA